MPDYKAMYLELCHAITKAQALLTEAQMLAEQIYVNTAPYDAALDEQQEQP